MIHKEAEFEDHGAVDAGIGEGACNAPNIMGQGVPERFAAKLASGCQHSSDGKIVHLNRGGPCEDTGKAGRVNLISTVDYAAVEEVNGYLDKGIPLFLAAFSVRADSETLDLWLRYDLLRLNGPTKGASLKRRQSATKGEPRANAREAKR